ncbi:11908_t:CDS:2, partial [Funneliformis caledonium]
DGQSQKDRETIAEISAVDESNSVIDQQNDVNTKSMEEVPEVVAEQSVSDKVIDDFILEESVNVPDSVIAKLPPIHEVHSQLNLSENLDSEPFIANISDINSQDSVIPLNEKDGQDVYLASLSSKSYVASPGFEYSKDGKVPYKQKVEKGL